MTFEGVARIHVSEPTEAVTEVRYQSAFILYTVLKQRRRCSQEAAKPIQALRFHPALSLEIVTAKVTFSNNTPFQKVRHFGYRASFSCM
jgi:hypothetical protein